MVNTIGNPLSWGAGAVRSVGAGIGEAAGALRHEVEEGETLQISQIGYGDLLDSLRAGFDDFAVFRADVLFLCLFYPVIGLTLGFFAFDRNLLPLLFPLASGFAILGPVAAVGLYEMSRRREAGETPGWSAAFRVFGSPAFAPVLAVGIYLLGLFILWMMAANWVWRATLGPEPPASLMAFLGDVFGTGAGWAMILVGTAVGFCFSAVALATSIVSFPILLDRKIGVPQAVVTSVRAARQNPGPVAVWGLIVATSLVVGSIPFFLGLVIVLPVLGHATWHLYRRLIVPPRGVKGKS